MYLQLKSDLLNNNNKDVYSKYLLGQHVWLFENDPKIKNASKKYDELKYYISDRLGIHFNNIAIVGSAKTGISFSPKKKFKLFHEGSDLDIILVSQPHYLKFWKAYTEMFYREMLIPEYDSIKTSIFKGFISLKNPTEKHADIKEWVKVVNAFVKDFQVFFGIEREINYRIYNSWENVQAYHFFGIKQLRNHVVKNVEKEKLISGIINNLIEYHNVNN